MSIVRDVRVKLRINVLTIEVGERTKSGSRPGRQGTQGKIIADMPEIELPWDELQTRLSNAALVLADGYELDLDVPAVAVTNEAGSITATGATLKGSANTHSVSTVVTFEYGTTKELGTSATAGESALTSATLSPVTAVLAGLTANTKYYYRVKTVTSANMTQYGIVKSFTTLAV